MYCYRCSFPSSLFNYASVSRWNVAETRGLSSKYRYYSQFWLYNGTWCARGTGLLNRSPIIFLFPRNYFLIIFPFPPPSPHRVQPHQRDSNYAFPSLWPLEWRFSEGACRRWRPRSDDSDGGREWFQLSIIPMLLAGAPCYRDNFSPSFTQLLASGTCFR